MGAYGDDDNGSASGSAYTFYRNQGGTNNWGEVEKIFANDGTASDYFGWSVSIDEDTVIVGAYGDDDNGSTSGSAYVYVSCILPVGHLDYCQDCGPCAEGEGDCDNDSECQNGLTCDLVPGTDTCQASSTVCPHPAGHLDYCQDCGPCAEGEGDCDNNEECQSGLICDFVPGTDTCFKPAGVVAGGAVLMFIPARALSGGGVRPGQIWSCSINRRGANVCRNVAPIR